MLDHTLRPIFFPSEDVPLMPLRKLIMIVLIFFTDFKLATRLSRMAAFSGREKFAIA